MSFLISIGILYIKLILALIGFVVLGYIVALSIIGMREDSTRKRNKHKDPKEIKEDHEWSGYDREWNTKWRNLIDRS